MKRIGIVVMALGVCLTIIGGWSTSVSWKTIEDAAVADVRGGTGTCTDKCKDAANCISNGVLCTRPTEALCKANSKIVGTAVANETCSGVTCNSCSDSPKSTTLCKTTYACLWNQVQGCYVSEASTKTYTNICTWN